LLVRRDQDHAAMAAKLERYDVLLKPVAEALGDRGISIEDTDRLASLIERGGAADSLRSQLGEADEKLEAARFASEKQEAMISQLREKEREMAHSAENVADYGALVTILQRVPGLTSQSPAEKLESLMRAAATADTTSANLTGQNAQMRSELARLKGNGGSGLPYCWALPGGQPQYMLKVEMQDAGVIVRDLEPRVRPDDPAWPLLDGVTRGRLIPMVEFINQTIPLKTRSNVDRCRYAIQVVDGTGLTNKPGYKQSMGSLWTAFMIREVAR
jgi:hypothetical protein